MNRPMAVTLALVGGQMIPMLAVLPGCGNEVGFADGLPEYPPGRAAPVPDATHTDAIVQLTTPQVDILWMVDNSCSMADEQQELTENFPLFMNFFVGSGLDYNVGVTSSDLHGNYNGSKGKLREVSGARFIEPETANPVQVFQAMATMGTSGSAQEQGSGAVYSAIELNGSGYNEGFYRDEASLHTVIISDEPDGTNQIDVGEFVNWYDQLKTNNDERTFSAIIDMNYGFRYENIALQIGGIVWDVQRDDWPLVLEELGLQAAGLKREYFLSHLPVEGTIAVRVLDPRGVEFAFEEGYLDDTTGQLTDQDGDGLPDGDWYYNSQRNSINFIEYIPEPLSTILIDYTLLASKQSG